MLQIRYMILWLGIALLAGCATRPKMADVKGKVTLDGAPMATGQVSFDAGDGTTPTTMEVKEGAFDGKATLGKKTVRISSFQKKPQKATGPGAEAESLQNVIPPKYNTESTESVEVKDPGPNNFDFKVTSK